MKRGVVYMTWGSQAIADADESMASLWKLCPDFPVLVVGDQEAKRHYSKNSRIIFKGVNVNPFQGSGFHAFLAGRVKPLLAELSPFEQSLYVDADTEFLNSPVPAFEMLAKWDLLIAETETRSLKDSIAGTAESHWTASWLETPHLLYHNSGMIFWRKNDITRKLFDLWSEEWQRFSGWDEQVALLRALLRSDAVYLTVPFSWNCREGARTTLLHHRFGTKTARKFGGRSRQPITVTSRAARGNHEGKPPAIELVRVEISPGRFVRCRKGEEEKVVVLFQQQDILSRRRGRADNV